MKKFKNWIENKKIDFDKNFFTSDLGDEELKRYMIASDEEYSNWRKGFSKEFPFGISGNVSFSEQKFFYIGGIVVLCERLGKNDFMKYIKSDSNLNKNYINLLSEYIKEVHPEMYRHFMYEITF